MREMCRHGHRIRGPQDRLPSGYCKRCNRDAGARYRQRCQEALALVGALKTVAA